MVQQLRLHRTFWPSQQLQGCKVAGDDGHCWPALQVRGRALAQHIRLWYTAAQAAVTPAGDGSEFMHASCHA
jgi:hypothetical protein